MIDTLYTDSVKKSFIKGSRRISNIFWAIAISLGGIGFFLTGLSSYFQVNLLFFSNASGISFIPQGIVLVFYGTVGSILGIFLCLTTYWNVGFGYNEYNKISEEITLYRKSFPGANREICLNFQFMELKSIKMQIEEGLNPKRSLFLCLKDGREIPLTSIDEPMALSQIENEAVELAKYLNIFLETA